jgi:hypothetical protein
MEKTIKETTRLLLNGTLTKEDGDKILLDSYNGSGRREQLIVFLMDLDECYGMHIRANAEKCVDDYLKNN